MSRIAAVSMPVLLLAIVALGCAGHNNPSVPSAGSDLTSNSQVNPGSTQTHLWGFYDVYIDIPTQTATCILNRSVMWSANVVTFLNGKPTNLGFNIKATPMGPDYVDVDIDVSITHPFPGLSQYNGYDVRGVFMGGGSASLAYNPALIYSMLGNDQYMLNDPENGDGGGPDGYTRWYNPTEFLVPGVLGYTKGKFATPSYSASATLNPYKYFADGLNAQDDVWIWLNANAATHGVFSAGAMNTRNYYLRFPNAKGVKYAYAVVANWEAPDIHPSNAVESIATRATITDDIWFTSPSNKGGNLILDIDVFNWSAVQMSAQKLFIESTVLSMPHEFTPSENTPTGGNENYSTYHVEIPADNILGAEGSEYWVIVQNPDVTYGNDFGIPNAASGDYLSAFFRHPLFVANKPYNLPPVVDSGVSGKANPYLLSSESYAVTAHDPDADSLTWSWTVRDKVSGLPVVGYDGVPGDGTGGLLVNWKAVGATNNHQYDIACTVSDGKAPPVHAVTLLVTATNVLFQDNMESGEGGWLKQHGGTGGVGWGIVPGGNDGHWWHSNNGTNSTNQPDCARLWTPQISIPAGVSNCHVEFFHTVRGYFGSNTVCDAGMMMASFDDGNTFDTTYKIPVLSGPQYGNWTYPYQSTYFYALCNGGCNYGGSGSSLCWGYPCWANSDATDSTSVVDYSHYIGQTIRIGWLFACGIYSGGYYWAIDDVRVTADP